MQAVEALTRLIALGDELLGIHPSQRPQNEAKAEDETAIAICQAMLNTAIPVARFRAHVTIEKVGPKSRLGIGEFTTSGVSITDIKLGLVGLSYEYVYVHATLWEQRQTGADMLSGYQGNTKSLPFRNWLAQLDEYQTEPTVQ